MIINKEYIFLLLGLLLGLCINKPFTKYIDITPYRPIYNIIIIILGTIICFLMLMNSNENFKNVDESIFSGIKGKTTMANLQTMQDKDIQDLESKTKFVKSFLQTKNREIEDTKYRKIPIKNSCVILNSKGTNNISNKIVSDQNALLTNRGNLNKNEMSDIMDMI